MKETQKKMAKYIFGLAGIIIVCCLIVSSIILYLADPSSYMSHETISSESGVSIYNAQTVLSDIRNGGASIFLKTEPDTDYNFPKDDIYNNIFSDKELFEISQYYFKTTWNDDPKDWRLVKVYYDLYDCEKGFDGPYSVDYVYEKKIKINEKKYVNVREVGISVWKNMISWNDKIVDYSRVGDDINWEAINYHAMDVYSIAEMNGGQDVHSESESECVDIYMALYGYDPSWHIEYNGRLGFDLIEMKINSKTGKVKN